MVDEKDWLILKTLSEEMSITKTAERLYISQPAITYRIKQIEKVFGVKIVSRSKKGVEFTTEGEYVIDYALNMLINLQQTKDYVLNLSGDVRGTLRLGVSSNFAHYKLPSLLKSFLTQYPEIQISVTTGLSSEVMQLLQKQEVHIGIVRGNHHWNDTKLLLDEEFICLISREKIDIKQLPSLPRIDYRTDFSLDSTIEEWWHNTFDRPPYITVTADKVETCKEMVKYGLGYSIIPKICLKSTDKLCVEKIPFENSYLHRKTWIMYRDSLLQLSLIKAFVRFIHPNIPNNN